MADIPENDPAVYQMLSEGKTSGVFQMESAGMTGVCVGLKPQNIEDITAIIALYRPGPMDSIPRFIACKQNPEKITYKHPALEPILSNTYGCIVYQEQVIQIFQQLAGYSLGQADMVRRAMSKKKRKEIERERQFFIYGDPSRGIAGCIANGIPRETAEAIYQEIDAFAEYAFNKAHAVCYAIVAYQTAWFKCRHPREYMAALLTSVLDSTEKVAEYIAECRTMGIALLPPDVNESEADFTVVGEGIRFGLVALKGVGRSFINGLLTERDKGGPFTDFMDFCDRMFDQDLNRRVVESLIKSGAFDRMGYRRSQLMQVYGQVLDGIAASRKRNVEGQLDLFGFGGGGADAPRAAARPPPARPAGVSRPQELMTMEKETTGLYLSGHPMDQYRELVRRQGCGDHRLHPGRLRPGGGHPGVPGRPAGDGGGGHLHLPDPHHPEQHPDGLCQPGGRHRRHGAAVLLPGAGGERRLYPGEQTPCWQREDLCPGREGAPAHGGLHPPPERPGGSREAGARSCGCACPAGRTRGCGRCGWPCPSFPGRAQAILYFEDCKKRVGTYCQIHPALVEDLKERLGEENVVVKVEHLIRLKDAAVKRKNIPGHSGAGPVICCVRSDMLQRPAPGQRAVDQCGGDQAEDRLDDIARNGGGGGQPLAQPQTGVAKVAGHQDGAARPGPLAAWAAGSQPVPRRRRARKIRAAAKAMTELDDQGAGGVVGIAGEQVGQHGANPGGGPAVQRGPAPRRRAGRRSPPD